MIENWLADNSYDVLTINNIYINDEGEWEADAEDENTTYVLSDNGCGDIIINYIDTK
ncbi:hypothetical protein V3C10_04405 [[Clostridium] symbiosum]|uniref:hypothetical protein n=1 Tax=Clostridium symbiosum TaxID=1512 RepID=UPI001D06349C|nr:hypothetical protein [[Clostridium] symbiosum]MCB6610174.1 hypothetical protein [[Clostridium] symbiosum]MCB6933510.1 hypothetical protein [[Clostridium] symbiosum]